MENIVAVMAANEVPGLVALPAITRDGPGLFLATVSYRAISEREIEYVLSRYAGKYHRIVELILEGKHVVEIADTVGMSVRRIRQLKNGNKQRVKDDGLLQAISKILADAPTG